MASQKLEAEIRLMGSVDGSVNSLSASLTGIGTKVESIGRAISVLSLPIIGVGKQVAELYTEFDDAKRWVQAIRDYDVDTMDSIDAVARQYGATTRYTATETMNAIGLLTQAGLDYDDMLTVLPTLLNMASAGQIDLASATELLTSNLYATGTSFDDASGYVDMLAMTASMSNSSIESLSEGVQRLGATSRYFSGGNKEVLTWLGTLQQLGYDGAESGTYLRNVMLALAAPTDKASAVMEALAANEDDVAAALADSETVDAVNTINSLGLQVYDTNGNLRSMYDIMVDLNDATADMTEQQKNDIMSKMFPKRTLGAANGMSQMLDLVLQLGTALDSASGKAQSMADIRESGIGGSWRMLKSASEELMLTFGESLSSPLQQAAGGLRDLALSLSEMPENTVNTLTDAGTAIAVAGPATMLLGKGFKMLGNVLKGGLGTAGWLTLGAVAIGTIGYMLYQANERAKEQELDNRFGTLTVSATNLNSNVEALSGTMNETIGTFGDYEGKIAGIKDTYTSLGANLSSILLDAAIYNKVLDESQKEEILQIGKDMYESVRSGIVAAKNESDDFIKLIFGDDSTELEGALEINDTYYSGLTAKANSIGAELRSQLVAALADGSIGDVEQQAINATVERLNAVMAEIESRSKRSEIYTEIEKAQRLGLDGLDTSSKAITGKVDEYEQTMLEQQDEMLGLYRLMLEDGNISEADYDHYTKLVKDKTQSAIADARQDADDALASLWGLVLNDSFGDIYSRVHEDDNRYKNRNGEPLPFMKVYDLDPSGTMTNVDLSKMYTTRYDRMLDNKGTTGAPLVSSSEASAMSEMYYKMQAAFPIDDLMTKIQGYVDAGEKVPESYATLYQQYAYMGEMLTRYMGNGADREFLKPLQGTDGHMFMGVLDGSQVMSEAQSSANANLAPLPGIAGSYGAQAGSVFSSAFNSNVHLSVQFPTFDMYGSGAKNLAPKGRMPGLFATGGRATEASIFGEAGAEWAIPEAHTQRTADLLAQATRASGFTADEIYLRAGGLSADPSYSPTVVFSPTINMSANENADSMIGKMRDMLDGLMRERERDAMLAFDA